MSELSISNVINISVSQAGAGAGEYNTSNIALFSHEAYESSFGTDGYKIYRESSAVATDFGTDSVTYALALRVFSQSKNILANGGYLVILPMNQEVQKIAFDAVPDSGDFKITYGALTTAAINFDATSGDVQSALRSLEGLEDVVVTGDFSLGFTISFEGVEGDIALVSLTDNNLLDGATPVVETITEEEGGETLDAAITRTISLVQYFGILATYLLGSQELDDAANVVQAQPKILAVASNDPADLEPDGDFDLIRQGNLDHTRCIYHGDSDELESLKVAAAYLSRGLSTNFDGDNTTQTMHLKDLSGVIPDSSIGETELLKMQNAGIDGYVSIQGVPKVFTSGANEFFDDVYNLLWYVGALQIAGFNVLAQTGTKIPQTEGGMNSLKSGYRVVCEKAVKNQFLAPGTWTSPDRFGNIEDFNNNIEERGYYIYTNPISQQSSTDREARKAPLGQIAIKYAGATHSSNVIVNVNK